MSVIIARGGEAPCLGRIALNQRPLACVDQLTVHAPPGTFSA